jgi:glycosyltransferase involved in cell wall biosynthesis
MHPGTDKPLRLLAVSRADRGKALEVVISSAIRLGESEAVLRIVGDGPELPALRRLAGDSPCVEFMGSLTPQEVLEEYARADVFVFPSRTDVFGLVLVEAMGAGRPIVTSGAPGAVSDLLVHGSNGIVVEENTVKAWSEAIWTLAKDGRLRERLGNRASETIRSRWTIAHAADAMIASLHLAFQSPSRRRLQ